MRQFLVTKMVCAKCGSNLNLSYKLPKRNDYADGEPTGAAMVQQRVAIEPCQECFEPVVKMRNALKTLAEIGEQT